MLAITCPGQGAQTPGMLTPWLELPACAQAIESFQKASGLDLHSHGTESDADTIKDTAIAQPLIVATALAAAAALPGLAAVIRELPEGNSTEDREQSENQTDLAQPARAAGDCTMEDDSHGRSVTAPDPAAATDVNTDDPEPDETSTTSHEKHLAASTKIPSGSVVFAGHSVGEFAAAALAGALTPADAVRLVAVRGQAMAQASAMTPTGMSAVVGGDGTEVAATLDRLQLTAANQNCPGQVVAAGTIAQLQALAADPPAKARVIPLQVAGAFHTQHMAPAVNQLREAAAALTPKNPTVRLLSNADGAVVAVGHDVLQRLVTQVSSPVRWDRCQQTMAELGVTGLLELPPAGTLVGLAKRALPGVATFALRTPADLDAAADFIAEHTEAA